MGHGKETPRQKMIGMMYLVLMAMLALNVSNEVLDAFAVLDEGLTNTKHTLEQTNKIVLENFYGQNQINEKKVGKWFNMANEVSEQADSIVEFIEKKKIEILLAAKEDTAEVVHDEVIQVIEVNAKDQTDAPARIMIGDNDDRAGSKLKSDIDAFREFLLNTVLQESADEKTITSMTSGLETPEGVDHKSGEQIPWTRAHFEHLPLAGVLSIMSGLQINIRNAQAEALKYLYAKIDEGTFKFTNLDATVIPNSYNIIKGNDYTAEIFIAARDSTALPVAHIAESANPYDSVLNEETGFWDYVKRKGLEYTTIYADPATGKAIYRKAGNSLGSRDWGGIIELVGPAGDTIRRKFKRSYLVAESSVVISPTKMNVFYQAIDNPVDISVAGVSADKVSATVRNASIKKVKGSSYMIVPQRTGNCVVTVYAEIDGKKTKVDEQTFRVNRIPDPVAKIGGVSSGGIRKEVLEAQVGVAAEMGEDFLFDLTYRVTGFKLSTISGGFTKEKNSDSYKLTNDQKELIRGLTRGQRVIIDEIKAIGPDGAERSLPSISLTLI